LVLETTYASIAAFREALERLMERTSEKAVLLSA
jgi:hypothetical protein